MKFLIIGWLHNKNKLGLINVLNYMNIEYKFGNVNDIKNYDIIYCPNISYDSNKYKYKKFIFGPHLTMYPDKKLFNINNINNNSIYIQPSNWPINFWKKYNKYNELQSSNKSLIFKVYAFPVLTDKFKPIKNIRDRSNVFIYYKRRHPNELKYLCDKLKHNDINYKIFDYIKQYDEEDYLKYLQESKYGIILDAHESQGFAIQEALSSDVPLLVWNVSSMNQEHGSKYHDINATSIPYWDNRCGEYFFKEVEFDNKYEEFISKLDNYKPREFILENLSVEKCAENFNKLL